MTVGFSYFQLARERQVYPDPNLLVAYLIHFIWCTLGLVYCSGILKKSSRMTGMLTLIPDGEINHSKHT